jgi:hypothetical protein
MRIRHAQINEVVLFCRIFLDTNSQNQLFRINKESDDRIFGFIVENNRSKPDIRIIELFMATTDNTNNQSSNKK